MTFTYFSELVAGWVVELVENIVSSAQAFAMANIELEIRIRKLDRQVKIWTLYEKSLYSVYCMYAKSVYCK